MHTHYKSKERKDIYMPVLDCSVKTCYYNEDNKCCLDSIKVEGRSADYSDDTACGSYRNRDNQMTNACGKKPKNTLEVQCFADKCTFNEANKCTAEHIGIAGSRADRMDDTECASFVSREN